MLFLENETQIDQNNYGTMLFMSKQVSLPKISSILQKMKIGQNSIYPHFARRPSIIVAKLGNANLHWSLAFLFYTTQLTHVCVRCLVAVLLFPVWAKKSKGKKFQN